MQMQARQQPQYPIGEWFHIEKVAEMKGISADAMRKWTRTYRDTFIATRSGAALTISSSGSNS